MTKRFLDDYLLLDSGNGMKLERFGPYVLQRPSAQALWAPQKGMDVWKSADVAFSRKDSLRWTVQNRSLPESWTVRIKNIKLKLSATDFGHLGIFPEHQMLWEKMSAILEKAKRPARVLNLFAYSGGASFVAAKAGAQVCHVDASKAAIGWAQENAILNGLDKAPIRWITDDVIKFLKREVRRGQHYDGIVLDPPTFGRGAKGEVFKIESDLPLLLELCASLLSPTPLFLFLSCHTPGFSPTTLANLLANIAQQHQGELTQGEMFLLGEAETLPLPSGCFAAWSAGGP